MNYSEYGKYIVMDSDGRVKKIEIVEVTEKSIRYKDCDYVNPLGGSNLFIKRMLIDDFVKEFSCVEILRGEGEVFDYDFLDSIRLIAVDNGEGFVNDIDELLKQGHSSCSMFSDLKAYEKSFKTRVACRDGKEDKCVKCPFNKKNL